MADKYLSIITNFGCHYSCPECIVRNNKLKMTPTGESQKLLRKHVGSSPIRNTTGSIESGACWVKRFGKSERRLTAGQTALICYRGGKHTRSP